MLICAVVAIYSIYWGIGWLSILIFNNQYWVALIGLTFILISIILGIYSYRLNQKAVKLNEIYEISKEIDDNWK